MNELRQHKIKLKKKKKRQNKGFDPHTVMRADSSMP